MKPRHLRAAALFAGALLVQSCAHAGASNPPAAMAVNREGAATAAHEAHTDSLATAAAPDSAGHASPAPVKRPIQAVLVEADSVVRARGGAHAEHARLFLSWRSPWGQVGATDALQPALDDTAATDTLYLCMQPGRSSPTFNGFMATLEFRCAPGDTLGDFWAFERTGVNAGGLAVQFGPQPEFPCPQPWTTPGMGRPAWTRTATGGRLRLVFAVPYTQAGAVDSAGVYALARVLIRHQRARLGGSAQPMCIEWTESSLAFALKDEPVVRRGERFVSWNSPRGAVCDPWRVPGKPESWSPTSARKKSR